VKDGSGALYDFAGRQNHKKRTNSDPAAKERQKAEGHKTYKNLDFQLHNPLKFKREGSRVKTWMAYKKFINLRSEFIM
jgi:hypothetical protein